MALIAALAVPAVARGADDAAMIREITLGAFKALIEQRDFIEGTEYFAQTIEMELRQDGATAVRARGRREVTEAIRQQAAEGTVATTREMIHVAVVGSDAVAVAHLKFMQPDGFLYEAVVLLNFAKADGVWLATRIVLCDNLPQ
jgi:hypothetical protein